MPITPYHAQYYAYALTQAQTGDKIDRVGNSLVNAKIDLNPHQIDAALFTFKSPLRKGALLADEVGLGKTIEAGIVLTQFWAEGKNKILIIAPSNLRKQWSEELFDKFFLSTMIMDRKQLHRFSKEGEQNPFDRDQVIICSYHFAKNNESLIRGVRWDLVVMDEAHKVRNVYKSGNVIGQTLKRALDGRKKLLLTATPLQNSLLELYGLVSFIDDYIFGDPKSFKQQFINQQNDDQYADLKERLKTVAHRNLRNNVQEYVQYTARKALTFEFTPYKDEQRLYELVSEYLQREKLYALPNSQRHLVTLVLRKLLASSSYAISGTLDSLIQRLEAMLHNQKAEVVPELAEDFEGLDETAEEWPENFEAKENGQWKTEEIKAELEDLRYFRQLAGEIEANAKGKRLKQDLPEAFEEIKRLGGQEKAMIFTESKRTQEYLKSLLEQEPEYAGQIVCFNGQNNTEESKAIYREWLERHKGSDKVTGSKESDTRAALVDEFREQAKIMIATEAAAEGINLQFCSLVVNYDLPWNPQRVEQRIGRCHRYGQKHDVVVVNFINLKNAADNRVYQLLRDKFNLFDGVFGASDEILGTVESGVDFEKRIAAIYQECRTSEEINGAFDNLQQELEDQINHQLQSTREKLLNHFDQSVVKRLKVTEQASQEYLNEKEQKLWWLTNYMLADKAEFDPENQGFWLNQQPDTQENLPTGYYTFRKNAEEGHIYRLGHPLAQALVNKAKSQQLSPAKVVFDHSQTRQKHAPLEPLVGKSGELAVFLHRIQSLEKEENFIFLGYTSEGEALNEDQVQRLFDLSAQVEAENVTLINDFEGDAHERAKTLSETYKQHRAGVFNEEYDKLDRWARDKQTALREKLKNVETELHELKKKRRASQDEVEKLELARQIQQKERERDEAEANFRQQGREIDRQKEAIMDEIEQTMAFDQDLKPLFYLQWQLD